MNQTDTPAKVASNDQLGHNAQERISFTTVCEMLPEGANWGDRLTTKMAREIVEAAVAAERERCAKLCEFSDGHAAQREHGTKLAAMIRGA